MKLEANVFLIPGAFFLLVAVVYGFLTDFQELVGFPAILLSAGLAFMVGIYFRMLTKRHGGRAEDREDAAISEDQGDQGLYAPWSWWPLVVAMGCALAFVAMAVGWWVMVPATIVAVIGLVGWVFEYSTGPGASGGGGEHGAVQRLRRVRFLLPHERRRPVRVQQRGDPGPDRGDVRAELSAISCQRSAKDDFRGVADR